MPNQTTRYLAQTAFGAALIAVLGTISLPTQPIPFTLLTLAIGLVATLLPPSQALMAGFIYLLMGAVGLPIFANGRAGLGILFGQTGGYIWGILPYLLTTSYLTTTQSTSYRIFLANLLGDALLFFCGWLGLQLFANMTAQVAFYSGVLPFIPLDLLKLLMVSSLSKPFLKTLSSRSI